MIGRAAGGWCSDNDVLKPDIVKSVLWTFEAAPLATVEGVEAKIDKCYYGTNMWNWLNTMKNKDITHVRVTVSTESEFIRTQYRILPGKIKLISAGEIIVF